MIIPIRLSLQGDVPLDHPRLNVDMPVVLCEVKNR